MTKMVVKWPTQKVVSVLTKQSLNGLLNIFPISRLQALCRYKKGLYELLSSAGEKRKSIILSLADPTGFALAGFARKRQNLSDLGRSYQNQTDTWLLEFFVSSPTSKDILFLLCGE